MGEPEINAALHEADQAREWFLLMLQKEKEAADAVRVAWESYESACIAVATAVREEFS